MKPDLRILRWRPSLFGYSGVADDNGVPGATTPQMLCPTPSQTEGTRHTRDRDFTQKAHDSAVYFHPAESPTLFLLLHTSPARFSMPSKRDEFFPASCLPFFCLSHLGRKEISTQRRRAAKVCFALMSGLFLVVSIFIEQRFLLRRGVLCFLLIFHSLPK